uniref:Uncharacterized protein n=1 Tax=Parascaris equorum TaxID=6256 RepID=A0A914R0Z4_PAREQ
MERFIGLFAAFVPLKMSIDEHNKYGALLRTLNLSVRDGKISVGDGTGMGSETAGAEWIVSMMFFALPHFSAYCDALSRVNKKVMGDTGAQQGGV